MDFEEEPAAEDIFIGEEGSTSQETGSSREDVFFVVDGGESMSRGSFSMVMQAAVSYLKRKIVAAETDRVGVILYNVQATANHMNFPHILVLQELETPDAPRIKALQVLSELPSHSYGHGSATLANVFWLALDLFTQNKAGSGRRMLLFTDEDAPDSDRPQDAARAVQRARDLAEQNVLLELFPFNRGGRQFDFQRFYRNVVSFEEDDVVEAAVGAERLEDLMFLMHKKEFRKRNLGTQRLVLAPDLSVGVKFFCTLKETKKPTPVKLHRKDNKRLKTVTKWVCEETGKLLWEHEIGTHHEYGREKVPFSKEEVKHVKNFDTPRMKLMGFKSVATLEPHLNIRPAYFVYPDDEQIKGSSQVLSALKTAMTAKQRVAIVSFIPRTGSIARFCALLPSESPPGFHMLFLPYADDLRDPESLLLGNPPTVSDTMLSKALGVVDHLKLTEFSPSNYYNPTVQHFYTHLEALALEAPPPPPIVDALQPDDEGLARNRAFIEEFFDESGVRKRGRDADDGEVKRVKVSGEAELKKLTVPALKEMCVGLGLKTTGRKDELIARIMQA
jgi:ATP-dependent DNA helicase 2 subunit 1